MEPKAPFANCEDCPLRDEPHVLGRGPSHPKIVVVGEAPGRHEVKSGIPFIGKSGQLLDKILAHNGIKRDDVYITNTVICRPPDNRTPTANEIKHCKARLVHEIKEHNPEVVLGLGAPASKALLDSKQGIKMLRIGGAKLSPSLGLPVVATFHPAATFRDPSLFPSLVSDVRKLNRNVKVTWEPTKVDVHDNTTNAIRELERQVKYPLIAMDIENAPPFDKHNPDLLCYALTTEAGRASVYTKQVVHDPRMINALDAAFMDTRWGFQFGTYDIQHLWGLGVTNARVDEDSGLAHYMTDERKGTHDLEQLATEYLGAPMYKQMAKLGLDDDESLADLPAETLYQYNGTDSDQTFQLIPILQKDMREDGTIDPYYNLVIPGVDSLSAMEYRGFTIDESMLDNLEERLVHEMSDLERELEKFVKNPRSPQQIKVSFAEIRDGKELPDTKALTLQIMIEKESGSEAAHYATKLLEYRSRQKTLSTYVRGFRKRSVNGKIYGRFLLHGTETGRLSSRNPNLQNVTQGELRGIFTASDTDYTLVNADYSAIELRVAALEIGSDWLLSAFRTNQSIHKEVATELFGEGYGDRQYRDGKTVTFGIFYDRQAPAIAAQLRIPIRQAQMMIDRWNQRCPELEVYKAGCREEVKTQSYCRSKFGRVRRFWFVTPENSLDVFREAYNFKIQSPAGDVTLRALNRIHREAPQLRPVVTVHDSITFDVPLDQVEDTKATAKRIMEDNPDFDIPMPVEFKEGYRWT